MKYNIFLSNEANTDFDEYIDYILYTCNAPVTAAKHYAGLLNEISKLEKYADIYPIQTHKSLLQYGINVRRLNYKKMVILYTIHGKIVYIHRIVAASMITDL